MTRYVNGVFPIPYKMGWYQVSFSGEKNLVYVRASDSASSSWRRHEVRKTDHGRKYIKISGALFYLDQMLPVTGGYTSTSKGKPRKRQAAEEKNGQAWDWHKDYKKPVAFG